MSITKTVAKGSAWMLAATFLTKFISWIYLIVLARSFPKEQVGMFFIVVSAIELILIFSTLGLAASIKRYVGVYAGEGKFNHVKGVIKNATMLEVASATVFMAAVILLADNIADVFHNRALAPIFRIMAGYIILWGFYTTTTSFLQARKMMEKLSYTRSLQDISKLIFTIGVLALIGATAQSLALGLILSLAFAIIISGYWTLKDWQAFPKTGEAVNNRMLVQEIFTFSLGVIAISSITIINNSIERLLLGYLLPPETSAAMVAVYSISIGFAGIITLFVTSLATITAPMITSFWAEKNLEGITKTTTTFIRWLTLTTTPIVLGVMIFSKNILSTIYGPEYTSGSTALTLYAAGLFIYQYSLPTFYILSTMKRLDTIMKITSVGLAINIGLNLILIPLYNIDGAAMSSAMSLTAITLLFFARRKMTHVKIPRDMYKMLAAGIITMALLLLAKPLIGELLNEIPKLFASAGAEADVLKNISKLAVVGTLISIASAIYVTLLIVLRTLNTEDVEIVTGTLRRLHLPEWCGTNCEKILLRKK